MNKESVKEWGKRCLEYLVIRNKTLCLCKAGELSHVSHPFLAPHAHKLPSPWQTVTSSPSFVVHTDMTSTSILSLL